MKAEILQTETSEGDCAYVLPNSIAYVGYDTDRNSWALHLLSGDILYFSGSLEDFEQWLKRSMRRD